MARLTKRQVDAEIAKADRETRLWDDNPRGLGLRIKPSGTATFFIQYTSPVTFKKARHSIDQYGRLTIDQARAKAKSLFEDVANGIDPALAKRRAHSEAKAAATLSDFCDDYMRDAEMGLVTYRGRPKKEGTLANHKGVIERHIKPLLGTMLVRDVTPSDVEKAMHQVRLGKTAADIKTPKGRAVVTGGPTAAANVVKLLGSIFSYAIKLGVRADNPAAPIEAPPDKKRDRVLTPAEYKRLGKALDKMEAQRENPVAVRAIRALALTGCRKGEIYGLEKASVDSHRQCLFLGDTKTGQQVRAIGRGALKVLTLPALNKKSDYVFPAAKGDGHLSDVKVFYKACNLAKLEGVTLHTLRHSFASVALELEYSELTIAGLLGHRTHSVTSRYAHHVDRALVTAADRVSALIAARLAGQKTKGAEIVPLRKARAGRQK